MIYRGAEMRLDWLVEDRIAVWYGGIANDELHGFPVTE